MSNARSGPAGTTARKVLALLGKRPLVLIGMMGAGKTTIGRRLASQLGRNFVDSDAEVEKAANMAISEIFEFHGEADFRAGEARVIARLLKEPDIVLATGGGAFLSSKTRELVKLGAISIWLNADIEVLFARVSRRPTRPLLQTGNPRLALENLIAERATTYAMADLAVTSTEAPREVVVNDMLEAILVFLDPDGQTLNTASSTSDKPARNKTDAS